MIIFLLPVYNEEMNIQKTLQHISAYAEKMGWKFKIYVSDDGSEDSTVKVVEGIKEQVSVEVVANPRNMGPGAAFDLGFRKILSACSDEDIIVTMEADNTSDLAILERMVGSINDGADLVLASCYAEEGGIEGTTLLRKILSKGANCLVGAFSKDKKIRTFSSFYRCHTASLLRNAYKRYGDGFIEEKGFVCAVDMLLKFQKFDIRIDEIPMLLKCDKRVGKSKMKTVRTTLSYLKLFIREVWRTCAGKGESKY